MFASLLQAFTKPTARPVKAERLLEFKRRHPELIVLDIRGEVEAREEGFIPGSLRAEWKTPAFSEALRRIARSRPLLVYCPRGKRSPEACAHLAAQGYAKLYYLEGGLAAWQSQRKRVAVA